MKNPKIIIAFSTLLFFTANISAQSGGAFAITQSVIASGGQQSSGGIFTLDGTAGQSLAGDGAAGGSFNVRSGFWLSNLAPTAANVGIGGRVRTANGSGIRNVIVTLTGTSGAIRTTQTGSFGYFRFDGVAVGEIYFISVSAKRYAFEQPTQIRTVQEEIADLDFVADEQ